MKPRQWIDRTPEERDVLAFRTNRRDPKFNIALHIRRCEGDERDYDLMYRREDDRRSVHPLYVDPPDWIADLTAFFDFTGPFR